MKIIAQRPGQSLAVADDEKPGPKAMAQIVQDDGTLGPPTLLQTLLAQGFWRAPSQDLVLIGRREWDPDQHPRDDQGRFADAEGGGMSEGIGIAEGIAVPIKEPLHERPPEVVGDAPVAVGEVTAAEKEHLKDYMVIGYRDINGNLRGKPPESPFYGDPKEREQAIKDIDAAIAKSHTTDDVRTYRGISGRTGEQLFATATVGTRIRDNGYVSTSTSRLVATDFLSMDKGEQHGIVAIIDLPEGEHALPVAKVASGIHEREHELLLPRGTTFEITNVSEEKTDYFGEPLRELTMRPVHD